MAVTALWLTDFRCFTEAVFEPDPAGLTVLRGPNGSGKTSILEAVGWLVTMRSFRGAPREALVRTGADRAILRAEVDAAGRRVQLEAEIPLTGPVRAQLNRQVVRRRADLAEAVRMTVFSPDDLQLVQGGPSARRDFLDEALVNRHPRNEALVTDLDRVLRQRTALLRQAGGRLTPEVEATLDVWDSRLVRTGEQLAEAREELVTSLAPLVNEAYERLAGVSEPVGLGYRRSWEGDLAGAVVRARPDDLRRQVTGVGPHRDELEITIGPRPSRTHASQGEQRSLALGLRLAAHGLACQAAPEPPVLLLDDVFSELDPARSEALVELLPPGQVLLTTATAPPPAVSPDRVVEVASGRLLGTGGRP